MQCTVDSWHTASFSSYNLLLYSQLKLSPISAHSKLSTSCAYCSVSVSFEGSYVLAAQLGHSLNTEKSAARTSTQSCSMLVQATVNLCTEFVKRMCGVRR
jgi:hypothetical protein